MVYIHAEPIPNIAFKGFVPLSASTHALWNFFLPQPWPPNSCEITDAFLYSESAPTPMPIHIVNLDFTSE